MKTCIVLVLAFVAACVVALALEPADAHDWVPRYDGAKWGAACLVPNPRASPATCCNFALNSCRGACGLADVGDTWKNACRANCQSAGEACLQRVATRPPVGGFQGTKPPATTQ